MSNNGMYFKYFNSISLKAKNYRKWVLKPKGKLLVGGPGKKGYANEPDHKVYYKRKSLQFFLYEYGFDELNSFAMLFYGLSDKLKSHCVYSTFSLAR